MNASRILSMSLEELKLEEVKYKKLLTTILGKSV